MSTQTIYDQRKLDRQVQIRAVENAQTLGITNTDQATTNPTLRKLLTAQTIETDNLETNAQLASSFLPLQQASAIADSQTYPTTATYVQQAPPDGNTGGFDSGFLLVGGAVVIVPLLAFAWVGYQAFNILRGVGGSINTNPQGIGRRTGSYFTIQGHRQACRACGGKKQNCRVCMLGLY